MGRILGLDYGDRHVGVALSDPGQTVATPRDTIVYTARVVLFEALEDLLQDEDIDAVVVGLPLGMSGEDTEQTKRVRAFAKQFEDDYEIPVHLEDERLSSVLADQLLRGASEREKDLQDATAAQVILQGYLDRKRGESFANEAD